MPVEFPGRGPWGSDLKNVAGGLDLTPGDGAPPGRLAALPWDRRPMLAWYHSALPKPGAKVLAHGGQEAALGHRRVRQGAGGRVRGHGDGRSARGTRRLLGVAGLAGAGRDCRAVARRDAAAAGARALVGAGRARADSVGRAGEDGPRPVALGRGTPATALTVLQQFYKTGKPQAVAKTAEPGVMDLLEGTRGTSMEPGLQRDASAGAMAIRLGAARRAGALGGAEQRRCCTKPSRPIAMPGPRGRRTTPSSSRTPTACISRPWRRRYAAATRRPRRLWSMRCWRICISWPGHAARETRPRSG